VQLIIITECLAELQAAVLSHCAQRLYLVPYKILTTLRLRVFV